MIEVEVALRIEAPAATVWRLVGDFNATRRWVPSVEHSTKSGDGVGALRTLLISGGARIVERLDAYDGPGRSYTCGYVAGPLPVKSYATTLSVTAAGENDCVVTWSSRIEPEGLPPEQVAQLYRDLYRVGLANLERVIARAAPGPGSLPESAERL